MTATKAAPRHAVAAITAALLVLLAMGSAALAQSEPAPRILVRDLSLSEEGVVELVAAISPDVTEAEVLAGLRVRENGVLVESPEARFVERTQTVSSSAEIALLLDTSGSTSDNGALERAKLAATDFVRRLAEQSIPVTLVTFSTTPVVEARRSTDTATLSAAIADAVPGGETSLYDAVNAAVTILSSSTAEQREIVLFTDGGDTSSRGDTPDGEEPDPAAVLADVAARASAEGLAITAVSLTTSETDTAALTTLATATSGIVLPVDGTAQLGAALGEVARSIASQLVVRWQALHPEAGAIEASLALNIDRGLFTSLPRSVANPGGAVPGAGIPEQPDPRPVQVPRAVLDLGGLGEPLGLAAGAAAAGILGFLVFVTPADRRSSRILKRQVSTPSRLRRSHTPPDDARVRDRVGAVLDGLPKPRGYEDRIQEELEKAAWPLRTGEFVGMRIGLALGGAVVGWAMALATVESRDPTVNLVLPIVLMLLGWVTPRLILNQRRNKRIEAFHEQMADTLQMLAGSLRAGYGLMQGIDNVSNEGQSPTKTEFGRVLTEVRLGISVEDALSSMAERVGSEDFRWVVVAIAIQRKVGGNLAELLDTVSATLREREQVRRQVKVLSAEGRLSAVVLIALPIVFALYLSVTQPSYLAPMFSSQLGLTMLGAGIVLLGLGIMWIRKVVEIDV